MKIFQPGFRLSKFDIVIIVSGILSALCTYKISIIMSFLIVFVISHFFIFCNIIRISRVPEIIWATTFTVLVGLSITYSIPSLKIAITISVALSSLLVLMEIRKPSYHGLCWQKINPNLESWFYEQKSI
jgi:hypothetical protein